MTVESSIRRILEATFVQASNSAAHWYSVKLIHPDTPSLSELLGVSQENLEHILCHAGFGKLQKKRGFVFNSQSFSLFLSCSGSAHAETTHYKPAGMSNKTYFIRVGSKDKHLMARPGLRELAPRIANITSLRTNFRDAITKTLLYHGTKMAQSGKVTSCTTGAGAEQLGADDSQEQDDHEPQNKQNDEYEHDILLLRIKMKLMPLLIQPEAWSDAYFNTGVDSSAVEAEILDMAHRLQQKRDDELSEILQTARKAVSPNTATNPQRFPRLKKYGISLTDRRVHEGLLAELYHLNKYHTGSTTLTSNIGDNKLSSFVLIPKSADFNRLKENERKTKWFSDVLDSLGGAVQGNRLETLTNLLVYIGRQEDYRESWNEAQRLNGHTRIPTIDAAATFAIQSACNMNQTQMKLLRRCLLSELGSSIFATDFKVTQALGLEYVEPLTGRYKTIEWSYKDLPKVLLLAVSTLLRDGTTFEVVDLVISMDHGKGYSRASLLLVARWKDEGLRWKETSAIFTIANAKCKKDNADIIWNTYGALLNDGIKAINDAGKTCSVLGNGTVVLGGHVDATQTIPLKILMAGDILFYSLAIGKEGYAGWWCNWCKLFKKDWQLKGHERGEAWTLEGLKEHATKLTNGEIASNVQSRCGVSGQPIFDTIEVDHYVPPILHLTIGKGNDVLDNLLAELQAAAEVYSQEYYEAEHQVVVTAAQLSDCAEALREFNASHKEYEKDLRRFIRGRGTTEEDRDFYRSELADITNDRVALQEEVDAAKQRHDKAKKAFAVEKKKDENSAASGQPLRSKIDQILRTHGIDRAAQFGGDLDGNGVRRLMLGARKIIMGDIQQHVLGLDPQTRIVGTDDEIREVCKWHCTLLQCMDGYFSCMRTKRCHFTTVIQKEAKAYRDKMLEMERYLGLSITPKDHLIEDHSVELAILHNGIGDVGEDEGERNHQLESQADRRLGCVRSFQRRELFKSKSDAKRNDPLVKNKIEAIFTKNAKRKNAGETEARRAAKQQKRIDDRQAALLAIVPVGTMLTMRQQRKALATTRIG